MARRAVGAILGHDSACPSTIVPTVLRAHWCPSWLKKISHVRNLAWLTSLRRHYPHQVQGVSQLVSFWKRAGLSAIRLPRNI
jgi:hypothetical protein